MSFGIIVRRASRRASRRRSAARPLAQALLAACLLLWPRALLAEECQPAPDGLISLMQDMSALSSSGQTVGAAQSRRMARQMDRLSETNILEQLNDRQLHSLEGIALDLMSEAERLSTPGVSFDERHIRQMLREFDHQWVLACEELQMNGDSNSAAYVEVAGVFKFGRVDWAQVERVLRANKTVSGGAVFITTILFIALLFGLEVVVRWIMALVYNRRACRVPAVLELDGERLPGLLLTLGRAGFRFLPRNYTGPPLALGCSVVLNISDQVRLTAVLSQFHETMGDFRLVVPLSVKVQNEVLSFSTISPYYIRKSRDGGEAQLQDLVTDSDGDPAAETAPAGNAPRAADPPMSTSSGLNRQET